MARRPRSGARDGGKGGKTCPYHQRNGLPSSTPRPKSLLRGEWRHAITRVPTLAPGAEGSADTRPGSRSTMTIERARPGRRAGAFALFSDRPGGAAVGAGKPRGLAPEGITPMSDDLLRRLG